MNFLFNFMLIIIHYVHVGAVEKIKLHGWFCLFWHLRRTEAELSGERENSDVAVNVYKDTGSIDKATCFARGKQKSGVVLDR